MAALSDPQADRRLQQRTRTLGTFPFVVLMAAGLHVAYGVWVWVALPGMTAAALQPALVMAWAGTAAMLGINVLVLWSAEWPVRGVRWLPALLLPDLAAIILAVSVVRA